MTWTNFLMTLVLLYFFYYGTNLLWDIFASRNSGTSDAEHDELFFTEESNTEQITYDQKSESSNYEEVIPLAQEQPKNFSSGNIRSTGGVGLKELFSLAKDDLIEFTSAIPY